MGRAATARTTGARAIAVRTAIAGIGSTLILLAAAYLVATTRTVVTAHNADSLIPIFVSLESWSLFYWGQDRFGMLLPLLARPIHDSFTNLLFQHVASLALLLAGLAAVGARLGLRRPVVPAIAAIACFVTFGPHLIKLTLLTTNQSYAPAAGLFGVAIYTSGLRSRPLALATTTALALLGAWTNGGVALLAVFVALAFTSIRGTRPISVLMLGGALLSVAGHRVLQTWAPTRITAIRWPAPGDILALVWHFWADAIWMGGRLFWLAVLSLWAIAIARACWRSRRTSADSGVGRGSTAEGIATGRADRDIDRGTTDRLECRCLLAIAVATFTYGCVMAIAFEGLGRHLVAALPLLVIAPIVAIVRTDARVAALAGSRTGLAAVAVWLVAVTGVHHPAQVRREVIAHLGNGYETTFYARGVTVITGDYWDVWQVTFATNLLHERHTGRRPVLPVGLRSEPLRARLLAHLGRETLVAQVPAGHLQYWMGQPDLPRLHDTYLSERYTLAVLAR